MITGVVLTRNEEAIIVECLEALRPHVQEIILIDMESTDLTLALAKPLVTKVLRHPVVRNFDAARNLAISEASNDWFWFVDADERIPSATGRLVSELIRTRGHECEAITIAFKSFCCGQWMRHCGWWPGYTGPRVLKRGHFQFAPRVHSGVKVNGRELVLAPDPELAIHHYGIRSVEQYVYKVNRASSAEAEYLAQDGRPCNWRTAIDEMIHELWSCYEKHPGRLDGERGWIAAWMSGQYRWLAQTKRLDFSARENVIPNPDAVPADLDEALTSMQDALARLRVSSPRLPLGIVWRGGMWNDSGYAEEMRSFVRALALGERELTLESGGDTYGGDVNIVNADQALFRALRRARRPKCALTVTHGLATVALPDDRAAVNVLRTMFETDRIPEDWLACANRFDEVWVPSRHVATAFRRSGYPPEKIRVVPACLDTDIFRPDGDRIPLPESLHGRFVFLSVFDWVPRKGSELLVESYCREFGPQDGVGLLLKLSRIHGQSLDHVCGRLDQQLECCGQSLRERPDIVVWDQRLSGRQMAALYRSVDAFVLPSRGEGWGRPYMEAMACGLPTIGTGASGNVDFMNEQNSLLIPAAPVEVPEWAAREFPLFRGQRWYEPSTTKLSEAMRQVVHDQEWRRRLGQRAAAAVADGFSLDAGARRLEAVIQTVESRLVPPVLPPVESHQIRVVLHGELFAGQSFSNINEQLCVHLGTDPRVAVRVEPVRGFPYQERPHHAHRIVPYIQRPWSGDTQVTIRHAYPPIWSKPETGLWVHIQPWEFGHLPIEWLAPLRDDVAEIWLPSEYARRVYLRSGIPAEKIWVMPWGVDPEVFTPEAPSLALPAAKAFRFLFVGGTIHRKGFDRLLKAYLAEFHHDEDVCLVVKDVGNNTVYRHNNCREQILAAQQDAGGPTICYLDQPMTPGQLASLFTACHCFVAPYRGEGFGLPILEAMACGLPAIVPQGGASDDYVTDETGYFLTSEEVEAPSELQLCGPLLEHSVQQEDLRQQMRRAFEQRDETQVKGRAASVQIRAQFTWSNTAQRMVERLLAMGTHGVTSGVQPMAAITDHGGPTICAVIDADGDDRALCRCLASLAPFVDEAICASRTPTEFSEQIAMEYGARMVTTPRVDGELVPEGSSTNADWLLYLRSSERADEFGMEQLKPFLQALPRDVIGAGVVVVQGACDQRKRFRQTEVRLIRRDRATPATLGPYTRAADEHASHVPTAPLEVVTAVG